MNRKLVIKTFKMRKKSKDKWAKIIVVSYNTTKVNGGFLDKIGTFGAFNKSFTNIRPKIICSINLRKLGYWLNKGAVIKSRPSWLVGLLSDNEENSRI